jgi:ribonuclease HI
MSNPDAYIVNIDGAARGNPGPAAFAYVIRRPDGSTIRNAGCLGSTTNNVAEYTALVRALTHAVEIKVADLVLRSDSELLVKQMTGIYKVKNDALRELFMEAKELVKQIPRFSIEHVPRAQNSEADKLGNEALDGVRSPSDKKKEGGPAQSHSAQRLDKEAVEYLKSVAEFWEMGKPFLPTPREVWKRLREIMDADDLE